MRIWYINLYCLYLQKINVMKEVILLLRVSTNQQDYEQQKGELIQYSQQLGFDNYHIINDKESAVKLSEEERNGLNTLKEMVYNNSNIKGCIVYEISRIARRQDVLHSMKEWFIQNQINLYVYDKKYQLLNVDGTLNEQCDLLFTLYGYFAESEAKQTKMRSKRGKEYWVKKGKCVNGKLVFGYKTDKDGYIIPDDEQIEFVKYLFNRYNTTDVTLRQLAKEMMERGISPTQHLRSAQTWLKCILCNYAFSGEPSIYSKKMPHIYPATIPKDWIDRARNKLANAKTLPRTTDNVYYCKSLLKSKENANLIASVTDVAYWVQQPYPYIAININIADSIVWYCVRTMIYPIYVMNNTTEREEQLREQLTINNEKLTTINKKELELNNELQRIKNLYIKGKIDDAEFEALESENIKNKGILSDSKALLTESNTNILQALKNAQEWFKISLIDISHLNDDVEIKKIIDICVKKIILTKDGNILNLNIESVFGLNYYFQYDVKTKEIKFLDEPIKLMISVRFKSKRKRG